MDVEALVKEKIRLEEQNKKLKEETKTTKDLLKYAESKIKNYEEKFEEIKKALPYTIHPLLLRRKRDARKKRWFW